MIKKIFAFLSILMSFLYFNSISLKADEGFINNNGVNIFYTDHGSHHHQPLVFIHGFPLSGKQFKCQIKDLSHSFRVITVDLRGFGNSDNSPSLSYNYTDFLSDVEAVVNALKLKNPVIAGHSLGSIVAEFYAATNQNISKLILLNPFAGQIFNFNGYTFGLSLADFAPLAALLPNNRDAFDQGFLNLGLTETCHDVNEIRAYDLKLAAIPPTATVQLILGTTVTQGIPNLLSQINVPTLVIYGLSDNALNNKEGIYEIARLIPNTLLKEIYGGHFINQTQSEIVDEIIYHFIKADPSKCHTCF